MNGSVVGLDVGGTKMAAAWVTPDGRRGPALRVPVPRSPGRSAQSASETPDAYSLLQMAADLIREASREAPRPIRAVGVGVPAVLSADRQSIVWAPNLSAWNSFPLGPLLSESLDMPAYIGYDGHMATLGEWWLGAGRGMRHMVLMTLGTGIGGGISAQADLLLDIVRETVVRHGQPYAARSVRIEKAQLGGEAGMLGAAKMALDRLGAFGQELGRPAG